MAKAPQIMKKTDDEINLLEVFHTFYSRKFTIFVFALITMLFGVAYALISPPVYQADALIQLEEKSSGGLALSSELSELMGGQAPLSVAEVEIIKSRMVLGAVIENLNLDREAEPKRLPVIGDFLTRYNLPDPGLELLSKFAWNDERITVGRLDLPAALMSDPLILTMQADGAYSIEINGITRTGKVGETLRDEKLGFALLVDELEGKPGRQFIIQNHSLAKAISSLRSSLSVSEKGRKTSILQLTLKDRHPDKAAEILDELIKIYLLQNLERNAAEVDSSLQFILEQLPESEEELNQAKEALNKFKAERDTIDLSFETRALLEQSIEIESELNKLELQEQELQKRYTPSHPAYQTLLDSRSQLQARLERIQRTTGDLPEIQQEMLRLSQDLEVAQEVYLQLQNRAQELKVIKAGTIGNVRIIDSALPTAKPVAPKKKIIVMMALILGLMLGAGFALIRSLRNRGIHSAEQIESLDISVYATVPKTDNASDALSSKRGKAIEILAKKEPTDLAIESLRSLRTSLHFGMLDAKNKLCTITSSCPGEGKSFVSVNLATVMAQSGQKTCLVDADIRRGYMNRYFGLKRKVKGLTDFLTGDAGIEDIIRKDEESGLHYITTGAYPPNPAELLMHERMTELTEYLDKNFDFTLLDTPPILAVTDPIIVAKYTGMLLLVARYDVVMLEQIRAAVKKLEVNDLKLTGAIFNGDDPKTKGYGYTNYQYHYDYKSRET